MTNQDTKQQKKLEIKQAIADAIRNNDEAALMQAVDDLHTDVSEEILASVNGKLDSIDSSAVLASRGIRQLTREERNYYQKFADAAKGGNPQQALTMIPEAFPSTVIDEVMKDIRTAHPLLDLIDFQNTTAITKWLVNKNGTQTAVWGALTSEITKELNGSFDLYNVTLCKLSAYFPVSRDIIDLGPVWIDAFVRAVMQEAIAVALETAIVDGSGKDMPIGMTRDVSDGVTVTAGEYPRKEVVAIGEFSPATYGTLLGTLATYPNGKAREVGRPVMLVNPADYFKIIFPATTVQSTDGNYLKDVLPYPTTIIQSIGVPVGNAVLGLPNYYFMGLGTPKDGKIEYSDEYRFLEDERVYKIKLYGNGRPKDNNAFMLLDISAVQPTYLNVNVVSMPPEEEAGEQ